MVTRVTIVAENDKPMILLGENANEKVKNAWESILKLMAVQNNDKVYVESAEVWDKEQTDCPTEKRELYNLGYNAGRKAGKEEALNEIMEHFNNLKGGTK